MPLTYEPIATTTATTNVTNIDFTNISQNYTDIVAIATVKTTTGVLGLMAQVGNNSFDSGSNYSYTSLWGDGTTADSNRGSNQTAMFFDYYGSPTTNDYHIAVIHFQNYSNTTTNKTVVSRSNRAGSGVDINVNLWRSNSAINQIRFTCDFNQIRVAEGSTITLYGIKAA